MLPLPASVAPYAAEVVRRLVQELGDDLVGVYTTGSLALGAFTEGRSDVDLLAVVTGPLPADRVQAVVDSLDHARLPVPAAGLELVVYPRDVVASGTLDAGYVLDLNTGRDMEPRASTQLDQPSFWYAVDRAITRQSGDALHGPPPAALFATIPPERLQPLLLASVRAHQVLGEEFRADDAVLNGARSLAFLADGVWRAKHDAARRLAAAGSPFADLLLAAAASHAAGRHSDRQPTAEDARAFLAHVVAVLEDGVTAS